MTVTQRKAQPQPDEGPTVNEPGEQYSCDSCACDLTHTIRVKCADPVCASTEDGVDICPPCFCAGKEFENHKRGHAYRVIEFNSYPIFTEDWGADEELLLIKGIQSQGLGNWKKIADHVGTRTKEEVEEHYNTVYVDSDAWPLPDMKRSFEIDPAEFQTRKRRRIEQLNAAPPQQQKPAPVSIPGIHEVGTYLPGRLEFEHEIDNEAEDMIKDLEFGVCLDFDGDQIPQDENDLDIKARNKWEEEKKNAGSSPIPFKTSSATKAVALAPRDKLFGSMNGLPNGTARHHDDQGSDDVKMENGADAADEENAAEEVTQPPPIETADSISLKFTLIDMYLDRVAKRAEAKALMFDRGLLDHKKMMAADKKRTKEERELYHRMRPFARLQTSADYENFATDILHEGALRAKIQELQQNRRLGLLTLADISTYKSDLEKRTQPGKAAAAEKIRGSVGRLSSGPDPRRASVDTVKAEQEGTPSVSGSAAAGGSRPQAIRRPGPLNLANSPSLHLLTPQEQTLCATLRILPKPYLVVKETLVREYARRGGKLRRREARELVKIDANKTSRVWDFLVQSGFLKINDPILPPAPSATTAASTPAASAPDAGTGPAPTTPASASSVNGSPMKDVMPPPPLPRPSIPTTSLPPPSVNGVASGHSPTPSG